MESRQGKTDATLSDYGDAVDLTRTAEVRLRPAALNQSRSRPGLSDNRPVTVGVRDATQMNGFAASWSRDSDGIAEAT